jgi:hypothetical protein
VILDSGQDVSEGFDRVDVVKSGVLKDRVENLRLLPAIRVTDEEPFLLPDRRGSNCILQQVADDLHCTVAGIRVGDIVGIQSNAVDGNGVGASRHFSYDIFQWVQRSRFDSVDEADSVDPFGQMGETAQALPFLLVWRWR